MITPEEIAAIQQEQEKLLPEMVTVKRRKWDGNEWVDVVEYPNVPARIWRGFGTWDTIADRFQGIDAHVLTFPFDQVILVGDKVITSDSTVFEVRDLRGVGSYLTAKQVLADKVT